ncbi:hypothetical protein, partial [Jiella marina]|uniref:hypothetical protein n=1 Tax=Jiella sp. LLJ827 TaxID=2917712 RepID=UPI002100E18D
SNLIALCEAEKATIVEFSNFRWNTSIVPTVGSSNAVIYDENAKKYSISIGDRKINDCEEISQQYLNLKCVSDTEEFYFNALTSTFMSLKLKPVIRAETANTGHLIVGKCYQQ